MRLSLVLGILSGSNILVSLLINWYIVITLGIGTDTDALFAGMILPQLVFAVLGGSLTHVLIPLLSVEDKTTFRKNSWGFLLFIGIIFTIMALVLATSAAYWVPLIVPGFNFEGVKLTINLTQIQLLNMVFIALISVQQSVYNAKRRFIYAGFSPLLSNLMTMIFLFVFLSTYGVEIAAWAMVFRSLVQFLYLLPGLGRFTKPDWKADIMIEAWRRIKPLLVGTAYYKTDMVVDRLLSSLAPAGGLSTLYFGRRMYAAGNQILHRSVTTPIVPQLATFSHDAKNDKFLRVYHSRLKIMGIITLSFYIIFIFFGGLILEVLLKYGNISDQNIVKLWTIMVCLGGFFIFGSMGQITSSTFYSIGDTKTPTKLGIWIYTLFIFIKIAAFKMYGLTGLALSTSLYYMMSFIFQLYFFKVKYILLKN